jgi:4-hydroxythreonine-4-phosphate dehydrogenase
MTPSPRILITLGDVAGIGPEVLVKAWAPLTKLCRPVVVGDAGWLWRSLAELGKSATVQSIHRIADATPSGNVIPCLAIETADLANVPVGKITADGGRAAHDFLVAAIDRTMNQEADGIVTLPLQKEGLHLAGFDYPGHTEILAERTGTKSFGMMLYARGPKIPHGLGVLHVTLHMALRDVFRHISTTAILDKIMLLQDMMGRLCDSPPHLAVAALNPHASDGGRFGDEERTIIQPAVHQAKAQCIDVAGPIPSDTLFVRAARGEFQGIVAMYHDQGHIPLKLLTGLAAVNISVGLPIVRTSVAHGTAYDIAGRGLADAQSLIEAVRVAARLIETSQRVSGG